MKSWILLPIPRLRSRWLLENLQVGSLHLLVIIFDMEAAKDVIHQKLKETKEQELVTKDDVESPTVKEEEQKEEVEKLEISDVEEEKKNDELEEEEENVLADEDDDSLIDHTIIKHGISGLKKKIWVIASVKN